MLLLVRLLVLPPLGPPELLLFGLLLVRVVAGVASTGISRAAADATPTGDYPWAVCAAAASTADRTAAAFGAEADCTTGAVAAVCIAASTAGRGLITRGYFSLL